MKRQDAITRTETRTTPARVCLTRADLLAMIRVARVDLIQPGETIRAVEEHDWGFEVFLYPAPATESDA